MTEANVALMFNNPDRQAQVARDIAILSDKDLEHNDKLDAAERIVRAAQTQALPAPHAAEAVGQVWRVLSLPTARKLAQGIPVNMLRDFADYAMP